MAFETATISRLDPAPELKPAEITPETTAKQLAAAVKGGGKDLELVAWLRAGPFSGRIIQAMFHVPFRTEEVSEDPVETMAAVYVKLRRHWPVPVQGRIVWLLDVMRKWWGGLPVGASPRVTPQQRQPVAAHADEDEDYWNPPEEIDLSFSTTGTTVHVPVATDYTASVVFDDEDKEALRDIRRRYRSGNLTKSAAISILCDFLDERVRDVYFAGNADEGDDHWDEEYAETDRDDESINSIESHDEAEAIVDAWDD